MNTANLFLGHCAYHFTFSFTRFVLWSNTQYVGCWEVAKLLLLSVALLCIYRYIYVYCRHLLILLGNSKTINANHIVAFSCNRTPAPQCVIRGCYPIFNMDRWLSAHCGISHKLNAKYIYNCFACTRVRYRSSINVRLISYSPSNYERECIKRWTISFRLSGWYGIFIYIVSTALSYVFAYILRTKGSANFSRMCFDCYGIHAQEKLFLFSIFS